MPGQRSPGLLGLPSDIVHYACSFMDKTDLAALSRTCSGLREVAVVHLFRSLHIKHSWYESEAFLMANVDPDIWIHVHKITFQMAPFEHIRGSPGRYWILRRTVNVWRLLLRCCRSLQRLVFDVDLVGLTRLDEPQAQLVWKSVSAIWDESQVIGSADTTFAVMFDLDSMQDEALENWSPNTWSGLFERIIGPGRLTEVTIVHTDDGPSSGASSLAHLPVDAVKLLSLNVHPVQALALDGSANLTNLDLSLGWETTPGMLFTILERFKSTLVTTVLKGDFDEHGLLDLWKNAAPCTPFDLPKLKKVTWTEGSDLTVVAKFFETAQVTQHCKIDISANCNEREVGGHQADALDMEVARLARAIERAGSQAIVDVVYYPASPLSARIGHFSQLSRSFVGRRSELLLTIYNWSYYEQEGDRPAIEVLHGLVKQGVSQAVYKLGLGVCDSLPLDSYRSEEFPATLPFNNVREVSLHTGKRYTKVSAFHLHFLLSRLYLPGLERLYLDFSQMEEPRRLLCSS